MEQVQMRKGFEKLTRMRGIAPHFTLLLAATYLI